MKPPKNQILRALWCVGQCANLTTMERMALLAIWLTQGYDAKKFGPVLLSHLIGTTTGNAKQLLKALKREGYITSHGGGRGRVAVRQVTPAAKLPKPVVGTTGKRKAKPVVVDPLSRESGLPLTSGQDNTHVRLHQPECVQIEEPNGDGPPLAQSEIMAVVRGKASA